MTFRYDALKNPNPQKWLGTDEATRIAAVKDYHTKNSIQLPNEEIHAVIHVTIENQIALKNETPVAEAMQRLMNEGLDRHDAIHAVGSVLGKFFYEVFKGSDIESPNSWKNSYFKEVRELTKEKWYKEFSEE